MKKLILFCIGVCSLTTAFAQMNGNYQVRQLNDSHRNAYVVDAPGKNVPGHHDGARTTAVTIAAETFGTGTDSTLPTGWTSGIISGTGTWHWSDWASTSPSSMGLMNSTTASNGWMIFDADSINNDCSCAPSAWLQSPAYNCSGHATVRLNFEEFYGNVQDTTQVWVSTDPTFATHTVYTLPINDALSFFSQTANVQLIHINITPTAALHPAVYVRFVYYGESFSNMSWMIDDMSLTELDPHDAGIAGSFMLAPDPTAYNGSVFNTPLAFVDSFVPGTLLSNYGYSTETSLPVAATIYNGTTPVYTQTSHYPLLPANASDSVDWLPPFKPTTTGSYLCALKNLLPGDADSTNNLDTVRFNVTDTTWMQSDTVVATNYFVNLLAGTFPGASASSSLIGTRFDVPSSSAGDTISGFGVAISPISTPTGPLGKVSIQLYATQRGDTTWTYLGTSVAKSITAADTSSMVAIKWDDFRIDTAASGGVAPFVLHPGTSYAAVLQMDHVTTNLLVFAASLSPVPGMTGGLFITDTSNNNGDHNLHWNSFDTSFSQFTPFIRMYFGTVPVDRTGINNIASSGWAGTPYPDPANEVINIPFSSVLSGEVSATLTNMLGQVVKSKTMQATGGLKTSISFTTNDLPEGVYNYSINMGNGPVTGRVEIMH